MSDYINHKVIFSIDFGTYGFLATIAHPGNVAEAFTVQEFTTDMSYRKVLNAMLIDRTSGELLEYGFTAQKRFAEAQEEKNDGDLAYFRNFKLQLLDEGGSFDGRKLIKAEGKPDYEQELIPLVSKCLRRIKDHCIEYYKNRINIVDITDESTILWVLSVPVLWQETSHQAMKACCVEAGIDEQNVLIVKEPDAAGCYLIWATPEGKKLNQGDQYLCVDIGSGTFDLVAHELVENRCLKQLSHSRGGLMGSKNVEDKFVKLLEEIFGVDAVKAFKDEQPSEYIRLLNNFQQERERVKENESKKVELPNLLVDGCDLEFQDRAEAYRVPGSDEPCLALKYRRARGIWILKIESALWEDLHVEVGDAIAEIVLDMLEQEECEGVNRLFLVGGFSKSVFIQKILREKVGEEKPGMEIHADHRAEIAVCVGCLWHTDKDMMTESKLCVSYGVRFERKTRAQDDPAHRVTDSRGERTINCFDTVFVQGESNDSDRHEERVRKFKLAPGQQQIQIDVYRSPYDVTSWTDEPGCSKIHDKGFLCRLDPGYISPREQQITIKFRMTSDGLRLRAQLDGTAFRKECVLNINWRNEDDHDHDIRADMSGRP